MNPNKAGLALGAFTGLFHLSWSILIALGLAERILDFVFTLHSLNNPYIVMPFSLLRTIELVVFTSIVGYIAGYVVALLWNKFHPKM